MSNEFRRGYKPLLGALIGAGCGLSSVCFYTNGVFVAAISEDMNWSRGAIQVGVSIMILIAVITAPTVGWLIDRYGARRIALISLPLFGITLSGMSLVTDEIWTFYAGWTVMSIFAAGTLPITWTKVVNGWFDDFRGMALGLTLAGTGIAATLAPSYVVWLIDIMGWRNAYVALAFTVMAISLPSVYLLFKEPAESQSGKVNQIDAAISKQHLMATGLSVKEALKGYRFWVLSISLLLVAASISGVITNFVPLLTDKGLSFADAARYAGLIGVSVIGGRLVAGFLMDRLWAPMIAAIFLCMPCLAAFILTTGNISPMLLGLSALIVGLAAGAELDLMAFLVSRYFGLKHYGALYGGIYIFFSIGAGLAPAMFGWTYDMFGHYQAVLYIAAISSMIGACLMLTLGRYPLFDVDNESR
jgi:MFS family permease|tara:strand:- start:506 stop:1753 length:1248 start_codon:yes stop_codon:yes gene_type:complete